MSYTKIDPTVFKDARIPTFDFLTENLRLPVETLRVDGFVWTDEDRAMVHERAPADDGTRGLPDKLRAWIVAYKIERMHGSPPDKSADMADIASKGHIMPGTKEDTNERTNQT